MAHIHVNELSHAVDHWVQESSAPDLTAFQQLADALHLEIDWRDELDNCVMTLMSESIRRAFALGYDVGRDSSLMVFPLGRSSDEK